MEPLDIDRLLDSRIVFKYQGSQAVAQYSRRNNFAFQYALHMGKENFEFSYFVPEHLVENREISILLAQSNARKQGDLYFVSNKVSTPGPFDSLNLALQGSKSSVLDNVYMDEGTFYFSFRFNSTEMADFSSNILNFTKQFENLGISYLGPNPGLYNILKETAFRNRLTRVIWEYEIPIESFVNTPIRALGDEWVSEVRYMTNDDVSPQLFKTGRKLENAEESGFHVISEKDHLYEITFSNRGSMTREYHNKSYDRKIVRFLRHLSYKDGKMLVETVIPSVQTRDLLQVLSSTYEKHSEFDLRLVSIEDLV